MISRLAVTAALAFAAPALAQDGSGFGGTSGPDLTLEATEPTDEAIDVGRAGDTPADIARYLLAGGASNGQLSPDGKTVAFLQDVTGEPQLWTVPAAGGQPKQLTFGSGIDGYRWTPDGSGLLYEADNSGNEQQEYVLISADGLNERVVLPAKAGAFRVFGGFVGKGGDFLYASPERNGSDFDIYRAALSGGESQRIAEGRYGLFARAVSPDGRYAVLTETVGEDADNLYLLDLASGERTTISAPESRANHGDGGFAWKRDSSGFYFASSAGREFAALSYYDVARASIETISEEAHDVGEVTLCGPDNAHIAYTINQDGFDQLRTLETSGDVPQMEMYADLPEGRYSIDCADGDSRLLLGVDGWRTPGSLEVIGLGDEPSNPVFAPSLAGLDPARFVRPKSVRYPARDGVDLQGLLYLPAGADRTTPPPVIFLVHGGPSAQSAATYDAVAQYHVNRGVAVFEPNVRGSTGFGRTYSALDDRENRLDSIRDLVDLLAALGRDGLVDADRAAVVGGSYGGYAVNAVLAAYPGAFKAGASLFGVADWVTALSVASPALKASDRIEYGDITEQKWKDFYTAQSPIRQADRIRVPVLYSHGVMDPRIDIAESETMVRTLRANGIDAPFIRIPDEGHGWRKLSNQLFYYRRQAEFLEKQLGLSAD